MYGADTRIGVVSKTNSARTPKRTATKTTIAAEMAEAVSGGTHYRILFLLGALLFAVTFVTNLIGDVVIHHFKGKLEGKK